MRQRVSIGRIIAPSAYAVGLWQHAGSVGGTSSAGLRSKKPTGLSVKPMEETGITGQSSGRGMWLWPIVYQTTTSVSSIERFARVNMGRPVSVGFWFGYLPVSYSSSGSYGVTDR